jgi:hypothetical protein
MRLYQVIRSFLNGPEGRPDDLRMLDATPRDSFPIAVAGVAEPRRFGADNSLSLDLVEITRTISIVLPSQQRERPVIANHHDTGLPAA